MLETNEELFKVIRSLVEAWCDRRCLSALRRILAAYPLSTLSTDSWCELGIALQDVRAFARNELTGPELELVNDAIIEINRATGMF